MRGYKDPGALPDLYLVNPDSPVPLIFIPIAKNASTTFEVAFKRVKHERIKREELKRLSSFSAATMWRSPMSRLISTYKQDLRTNNTQLSFNDYILERLNPYSPFDNRLCAQHMYCTWEGKWLPDTVVGFYPKTVSSMFSLGPLEHHNKAVDTRAFTINSTSKRRIEQFYFVDQCIWDKVE